jgi:hypothetical protein
MPDDLGSLEDRLRAQIKKKREDNTIFSGKNSVAMWEMINNAKTVSDLKEALFVVCCRLQDLESKL